MTNADQPTPAATDHETAWRAIEYHAEQLWDATADARVRVKLKLRCEATMRL